jgi:small subunit ribosomal protein S9
MAKIYATGKRKTAIAKVWITPGSGKMAINGQTLDEWLGGLDMIKKRVMQPLVLSKQEQSIDVIATTLGGGFSAQADALRHGISRALVAYDPDFRAILKPEGLLTRDSRTVERKKFGRRKARRSPQFSKR